MLSKSVHLIGVELLHLPIYCPSLSHFRLLTLHRGRVGERVRALFGITLVLNLNIYLNNLNHGPCQPQSLSWSVSWVRGQFFLQPLQLLVHNSQNGCKNLMSSTWLQRDGDPSHCKGTVVWKACLVLPAAQHTLGFGSRSLARYAELQLVFAPQTMHCNVTSQNCLCVKATKSICSFLFLLRFLLRQIDIFPSTIFNPGIILIWSIRNWAKLCNNNLLYY